MNFSRLPTLPQADCAIIPLETGLSALKSGKMEGLMILLCDVSLIFAALFSYRGENASRVPLLLVLSFVNEKHT
jgi:hypothetical protein